MVDYPYKCDPNAPNPFGEQFCAEDCRFSAYNPPSACHPAGYWTPARFTFEGYWHNDAASPLCASFTFNVCPNCGRILNPDGTVEEEKIRDITYNGFTTHTMPAPEFAVDVLNTWDAIAWEGWSVVAVTFAGETKQAKDWQDCMVSRFNHTERIMYEELLEKRQAERGCK